MKFFLLKLGWEWRSYIKHVLLCQNTWDALRELVSFFQFKKHENTNEGVLFLVIKVTLLHRCFSRFYIVQILPNRAKRLIGISRISVKTRPKLNIYMLLTWPSRWRMNVICMFSLGCVSTGFPTSNIIYYVPIPFWINISRALHCTLKSCFK